MTLCLSSPQRIWRGVSRLGGMSCCCFFDLEVGCLVSAKLHLLRMDVDVDADGPKVEETPIWPTPQLRGPCPKLRGPYLSYPTDPICY